MSDASVFADIRTALRTQLLTVVGLPVARKLEGESLDPPSAAAYIRETLLRKAPPVTTTIGPTPRRALRFLYQIDVFTPATNAQGVEQDATALELLAGSIVAAFPTSNDIAFPNGRIQITRVGMATLQEGTPHDHVPVEIYGTARWTADV